MKNIRLQYTAWENMPAEYQSLFVEWLGNSVERGQTFYELYFYWFNIPHEIGHALREYYGTTDTNHWDDETAVNSFAAAYWQQRCENPRLQQLHELIRVVFAHLQDPLPPGEERASYFDKHYSELATNPPAFGHFHFGMVLAALEKQWNWQEALRTLITPAAKDAAPPSPQSYATVNADLPPRIVSDMRDYLRLYGLELPEIQITCSFVPEIQYLVWDD